MAYKGTIYLSGGLRAYNESYPLMQASDIQATEDGKRLDVVLEEKLDSTKLEGAINTALENAKESGEFDGKTPTFKIEGGELYPYYDNQQGTSLGKVVGDSVTISNVTDVTDDSGNIIGQKVTFSGGADLTVYNGENYNLTEQDKKDIAGEIDTSNLATKNDLKGYATTNYVDTAIKNFSETDPKALEALKELAAEFEAHEGAYETLLAEVGNKVNITDIVDNLTSKDEANKPLSAKQGSVLKQAITNLGEEVSKKANLSVLAKVATSGSYNDLDDKPDVPDVPTKVSVFENDAKYVTKPELEDTESELKNDIESTNSSVEMLKTTVENLASWGVFGTDGTVGLRFETDKEGNAVCKGINPSSTTKDITIGTYYSGTPIKRIKEHSFENRQEIETVEISNNVEYIGYSAFRNCQNLIKVSIGRSISLIDHYAFENCINLKEVSIADRLNADGSYGTTEIDIRAFCNCESIETIHIPRTVTKISPSAFNGCVNLREITVAPENEYYTSIGGNLYYKNPIDSEDPNAIQTYTLIKYASGKEDTKFTFPNDITVTKIEDCAFHSSKNLSFVTIPDGIPDIDFYTFENCSGLREIVIPKSVTNIRKNAFKDCSNLKSVYYRGSQSPWNSIIIEDGNDILGSTALKKYWYTETPPSSNGDFWHYINGVVTVWGYDEIETPYLSYTLSDNGECYSVSGITSGTPEIIYIPRLHNGKPVRSIAPQAFKNKTFIKQAVIRDNITTIGDEAFYNCMVLSLVLYQEEKDTYSTAKFHNNLTSIGDYAFYRCGFSTVIIPDSVTTVGWSAFERCSSLTTINIGKGLNELGQKAFAYTQNLKYIVVSQDNTQFKVSDDAFLMTKDGNTLILCAVARNVIPNIPNTVKGIESGAFAYCLTLTELHLPQSVETIWSGAFENCENITEVHVHSNMKYIYAGAFAMCVGLRSIVFYGRETDFKNIRVDYTDNDWWADAKVTYEYPDNELAFERFLDKDGTYYYMVTGIGKLNNKKDITIPATYRGLEVRGIADYAFKGNEDIMYVTISEGVSSIGKYAFYSCSNLRKITIPNTVNTIGEYAFCFCESLWAASIPKAVTNIEPNTFRGCKSIVHQTIPDNITTIGDSAFEGCSKLKYLLIKGDSVTSIGTAAFRNCDALEGVIIPDSVTELGDYAFAYCKSLETVSLTNNVSFTAISWGLFENCGKLSTINIPSNVTSIKQQAFIGCVSLTNKDILFNKTDTSTDEPTLASNIEEIGNYSFQNCGFTAIEIPNSVKIIGEGAFQFCSNLESLTIVNGVTTICENAFISCSKLTSVTIPESVTSLGRGAFARCNLNSIESKSNYYPVSDGILYTKDFKTLLVCPVGLITSAQNSITILDSVETIGYCAFCNCTNLKQVTIRDVKYIEDFAFENCPITDVNYYYWAIAWNKLVENTDYGNDTFLNANIHYWS